MREAALKLIENGCAVFPCHPDKRPATPHGFKDASLSPEAVKDWFPDGTERALAIPCGEIVALDIDSKYAEGLTDRFQARARQYGIDLSRLPYQDTPNGGGRHYFFRPASSLRNEKLAANEDGEGIIEIRGRGGYVLIAPSAGYKAGGPVELWEARQLSEEEQDGLLSLARSFNEREIPAWEPPQRSPWDRSPGDTPGDRYNETGDVFALLREHGWHSLDSDGHLWRRPGKATGISATWDRVPGKFYVFTSSSELEPGKAYSPFALYSYLEHGGDFSAAAASLRTQGYGGEQEGDSPRMPEGVSLERLLARMEGAAVVEAESSIFTDLNPILDGDLSPELPTLCADDEGECFLFYAGRLNELHAEPGVGKTNVLLAACARMIREGVHTVFVDPEDNPRAISRRLLSMGAEKGAIRRFFHYIHDPDKATLQKAVAWARQHLPGAVCIDGAAELISGTGGSERDEDDVLRFFRSYVRPFAEAGAGVIISDHVAKDSEHAGLWPRGSGAKMGRYDGAVYLIREWKPYDTETAGAVKLVIAKDRNGGVGPKKSNAFEVHFTPEDGQTIVEIRKSRLVKNEEPDDSISKRKAINNAFSTIGTVVTARALREAVGGRAKAIDALRDKMAEEGYLDVRRDGNSYQIRKIREYWPCYQGTLKNLIRAWENVK